MPREYSGHRSTWKNCVVCQDEFMSEKALACLKCRKEATKMGLSIETYIKMFRTIPDPVEKVETKIVKKDIGSINLRYKNAGNDLANWRHSQFKIKKLGKRV